MKWEKKTLDELGTVGRGRSKHRPRNDPKLFGGKYPFIQTADVKNANFYIINFSSTYNEEGLAQSKLWPAGTLCITIAANIADTGILAIPACFPDSIMGFVANEEIADTRFVKYCFDVLQKECKQISQGTAQDNLSWEKLSTIKFLVPPLQTQKRIASILSAYDDLIENNQKQIKLLEEAAQRLYKEWFVDLRFPGHESVKIVDGVPEGWSRKRLDDIAYVVMGQSPKSEYYNNDLQGLPFHQGVGSYGYRFLVDGIYSTSYTRIADAGSIIFSVRAPVGRLNITKYKVSIGRGLSAMVHKHGYQGYLFYMLKNKFFKDDILGNGSIFASITKDGLLSQTFICANDTLLEKFNDFATNIDKKIEIIDSEISSLREARDRLLPKLMSGEIEV